jgi:predicted nuclease of restriction endonuclease-like (RecB) superfamily
MDGPANLTGGLSGSNDLLRDIRGLIVSARAALASQVNEQLTLLYWHVGRRIRDELLGPDRADYGRQIVSVLGRELSLEFGNGFSDKSLWHMIRFAEVFSDQKILSALRRQLSWTHFKKLVYIEDPLKRDFYAEMCRIERWSTRTLERKMCGMLYERTALSRKPAELIREELDALRLEDRMTPDLVFRDPYLLDFLGLRSSFQEKDLESAIIRDLEQFILELGAGFAFVARQKRISIDDDDHYLDLLFFHRGLRRLVAIELKMGEFRAADKGQMELYLRWLQKYETQPGEEPPLGLILCAGKKRETIQLLELGKANIRVASYWLDALPRQLLEQKLRDAVTLARELTDRLD